MSALFQEGNEMSLDTNKALVRRHIEEGFNQQNRAVLDETLADNYVDHTNPPGWPPGREGHRQILALYHAAFPDFRYTIEHEVAERDLVVVRGTYTGTHTGEFFGIAPTGVAITTTGMHLWRIANHQIAEHWCNNDDLGVMRQLGVVS
jgi:predicted ester cyclase